MGKWIAMLLVCSSMQAHALEVEGVKLEDKVQVGNAAVQLNGAGLRSIFFMKIYVAALYLESKQTTAEAILADSGAKRMALHVVVGEAGSERFVHAFRNDMEKNTAPAQFAVLLGRIEALEKAFENVKTVTRGDTIAFDWLPGKGTHVTLNGKELGNIQGEDFYRALLSIWIGEEPVNETLKKELVGNQGGD